MKCLIQRTGNQLALFKKSMLTDTFPMKIMLTDAIFGIGSHLLISYDECRCPKKGCPSGGLMTKKLFARRA